MSIVVKYSDLSTYSFEASVVKVHDTQDVTQYHIPFTQRNLAIRLGLSFQEITITCDQLSKTACKWWDVIAISLDSGTSYQTVYFSSSDLNDDRWSAIYPYSVLLIASPLKEQAAVRYPTTGYKWGLQSITGISQAGNVSAFPIIHYLAPLFFAPLSNTLIDFAGQSVTFTRTASKVHAGVTYGVNVPIFDSGLYLASDTAQDVATWTPVASTLKTIAMQIKSRYPSLWSIGGGGVNLLTANQSNAETNTTGVAGNIGTLTRNTTTPLVGTGDFKLVAGAGAEDFIATTTKATVTAGALYNFQALVKTSGMAAGRLLGITAVWYMADGTTVVSVTGEGVGRVAVSSSWSTPYRFSVHMLAPALAAKVVMRLKIYNPAAGEIVYADSLMVEYVPFSTTLWTAGANTLAVGLGTNLLTWTDWTTTVSLALPAEYVAGMVIDVVVIENPAHAVTIAVHSAGGAWTSASGTLANIVWPQLTLGNLEGSIANLVQFPYVLSSAEYQALAYSSLSLLFNSLYIGNKYAGEVIKGSNGRLVNASGSDISALLGGTDIAIGSAAVAIAQSQGLSARWYVELQRTDV
jgi:hypothetical protein